MAYNKYTKEKLEEAVSNATSFAGVVRYLGIKQAGGSQAHIANRIRKENIDISHFTGQGHLKGKTATNRKSLEEILIVLPEGSAKPKTAQLNRALLESGVLYKCALCPITDTWQGLPIKLDVDHVDGNWLNNIITNLRFLCPNCHSQQLNTNMPHKYRK